MALTIEQLSFHFEEANGTPLITISPIESIALQDAEWLGVEGGNGSGKSTFAAILAGWVPTLLRGHLDAKLWLDGESIIASEVVTLASKIQFVQQAPQWQLSGCAFTVEEELTFGPENLGLTKHEILTRLESMLIQMDLVELRKRQPSTLSGGEMQRLILGCALMMTPKLLILDEAFSRMTPAYHEKLLVRLQAISQTTGMNIVLCEKNREKLRDYCHHFYTLRKPSVTV